MRISVVAVAALAVGSPARAELAMGDAAPVLKEALTYQEKAMTKLPAGMDAATRKEMTDRLNLYKSKAL